MAVKFFAGKVSPLIALFIVLALFRGSVDGFTCPDVTSCDRSKCAATVECLGGVVRDECGCCDQCARVKYESCGGLHGFAGRCDEGLTCVLPGTDMQGQLVDDDTVEGQCLELRESCASLRNYSGCNLVDGECLCSTISACEEPTFDFDRPEQCYRSSSLRRVIIQKVSYPNCSEVHCEDDQHVLCTTDSVAVPGQIPSGECCPTRGSSRCRCNPELVCHVPECVGDFERVIAKPATGIPGECCHIYECVYTGKNCSAVQCPESEFKCPNDSYALPGIRSEDECCSKPEGCDCLPTKCKPAECGPGQRLKIISTGNGQPGTCCDQFRCFDDKELTCMYEDHEYADGSTWQADKCTTCTCKDGLTHCDSAQCQITNYCGRMEVPDGQCCPVCTGCVSSSGVAREMGERWKEDDCTLCTCNEGKVECQAEMCAIHCSSPRDVVGQCCPQCDAPTLVSSSSPSPLSGECSPISCSLECPTGRRRNASGCHICQCMLENCDLDCYLGYEMSSDGHEICKCKCPVGVPADCDKKCIHGYRLDASTGCPKCRCARCRPIKCVKKCAYGHALNDRGCKTCKCLDVPENPITTTDAEFYDTTSSVGVTEMPPLLATNGGTGTSSTDDLSVAAAAASQCVTRDGSGGGMPRVRDEGEMWHDGCRNCYCHAGREMCGLVTCPVPDCPHPVVFPGECCPKCLVVEPGSSGSQASVNVSVCQSVDGHHRVEGETWDLSGLCTRCICHSGQVLCTGHSCPPAPCANPITAADGSNGCCPVCVEATTTTTTNITNAGRSCTSPRDGRIHSDGEAWRVGACRSCACSGGNISCFSEKCRELDCERPVLKKGQCCPFCLDARPAPVCVHEDVVYVSGEMWSMNACTQCVCVDGKTLCKEKVCSVACSNPTKIKGLCCPVCIGANTSWPDSVPTSNIGVHNADDIDRHSPTIFQVILLVILLLVTTLVGAALLVLCVRRRHKKFHFQSQKLQNNCVADVTTSHPKVETNNFFKNIDYESAGQTTNGAAAASRRDYRNLLMPSYGSSTEERSGGGDDALMAKQPLRMSTDDHRV